MIYKNKLLVIATENTSTQVSIWLYITARIYIDFKTNGITFEEGIFSVTKTLLVGKFQQFL